MRNSIANFIELVTNAARAGMDSTQIVNCVKEIEEANKKDEDGEVV